MNKKILIFAITLGLLCVIAFVIISTAGSSLTTDLVQYGWLENSLQVEALVVHEEHLLVAESSGFFETILQEGQRVSGGQRIGTIYKGDLSVDVATELRNINSRLLELEAKSKTQEVAFDDVHKIDTQIADGVKSIISFALDGNGSYITNAKTDLDELQHNKLRIQGKTAEEPDETAVLLARKQELETGLQKSDLYAPVSGVFSYTIDGLEDKVGVDSLESMTPDVLKTLLSSKQKKASGVTVGQPVAKIMDNYQWYLSFCLTKNELDTLEREDVVYLRFSDQEEEAIPAIIHRISPEQDGEVCVSVSCTREVPATISNRTLKVTLVKQRYEGFKFSREAVRMKDNRTGVYAIKQGTAVFRPVEILFSDEDFVVVSTKTGETNQIALYDSVIVKADKIEEGKLLS